MSPGALNAAPSEVPSPLVLFEKKRNVVIFEPCEIVGSWDLEQAWEKFTEPETAFLKLCLAHREATPVANRVTVIADVGW